MNQNPRHPISSALTRTSQTFPQPSYTPLAISGNPSPTPSSVNATPPLTSTSLPKLPLLGASSVPVKRRRPGGSPTQKLLAFFPPVEESARRKFHASSKNISPTPVFKGVNGAGKLDEDDAVDDDAHLPGVPSRLRKQRSGVSMAVTRGRHVSGAAGRKTWNPSSSNLGRLPEEHDDDAPPGVSCWLRMERSGVIVVVIPTRVSGPGPNP